MKGGSEDCATRERSYRRATVCLPRLVQRELLACFMKAEMQHRAHGTRDPTYRVVAIDSELTTPLRVVPDRPQADVVTCPFRTFARYGLQPVVVGTPHRRSYPTFKDAWSRQPLTPRCFPRTGERGAWRSSHITLSGVGHEGDARCRHRPRPFTMPSEPALPATEPDIADDTPPSNRRQGETSQKSSRNKRPVARELASGRLTVIYREHANGASSPGRHSRLVSTSWTDPPAVFDHVPIETRAVTPSPR